MTLQKFVYKSQSKSHFFNRNLALMLKLKSVLCYTVVKTHSLSLSWGWSCGAAPWKRSSRLTRQRNWQRSSATPLERQRGRSSALCWTLRTRTPSCSPTPYPCMLSHKTFYRLLALYLRLFFFFFGSWKPVRLWLVTGTKGVAVK